MYKSKETIYIKAISSVHAGTGQSLTSVDMPIQRESHSNIPKIEGSSLKGSLKHTIYHKLELEDKSNVEYKKFEKVLGSEDGTDNASALAITDAKLLFFPMRSATDIYKLVTCPYVINRWSEDTEQDFDDSLFQNVEDGTCIVHIKTPMLSNKIMIEEYIFEAEEKDLSSILKDNLAEIVLDKLVILSDSDFIDMVTMYTEIITRNRIDVKTGTAQGNGLFTEEYLPSETIMYFSVLESAFFRDSKIDVLRYFNDNIGKIFQIGGNETIGKGIVEIIDKNLYESGVK